MKAMEVIIKNKLWSVLKENSIDKLEKGLFYHLFHTAKTHIIEEIKTEGILKEYLKMLLNFKFPYIHEKKMFLYLEQNMDKKDFLSVFKENSSRVNLLYWTQRNKTKTPYFPFLKYINSNLLKNGVFLYDAIESKNSKMIDFAININEKDFFKIKDIKINLLSNTGLKGDLKIKLLKKFPKVIEKDIYEYLLDNIKNEDEKTTVWIIENYYKKIQEKTQDFMVLLHLPFNSLQEKLFQDYPKLFVNEKTTAFYEHYFEKIFKYKKDIEKSSTILEDTCNLMTSLNLVIPRNESSVLIHTYLTYDNMDYLLTHKLFEYELKDFMDERVFNIILLSIKETSKTPIEDTCEKMLYWKVKLTENQSLNILKNHLTPENLDEVLNGGLFNYNIENLLHNIWKKDIDLGVKLAKKLDKKSLWSYLEKLNSTDRTTFQIAYYNDKFDEKPKEKRMKI